MEDFNKQLDDKLFGLIQTMHTRIQETDDTKKLAQIIQMSLSMGGAAYKALIGNKLPVNYKCW